MADMAHHGCRPRPNAVLASGLVREYLVGLNVGVPPRFVLVDVAHGLATNYREGHLSLHGVEHR